MHMTLCTVTEE